VSDTPRTDAVYFKQGATMYDLANEMKLVERELNAANERIKRLEDRIHRASMAFFRDGSDGQVASGMLAILEEERNKL
jgi:hypothetical protein